MICPKCKKETPTIFNSCQNCKADLREFHDNRNMALEGTGEGAVVPGFEMESRVLNWGPVGGIVLMLIACVWFFGARAGGVIFYYPPVLFLIGLVGFFVSLQRTFAKKKSQKKLMEMEKKFRIPAEEIILKDDTKKPVN